jgi:O-acetyl-ADP-ribose deacetylase (regulator of RNase III)
VREVLYSHQMDGGQNISLVQGDITQEAVDAIVNAANERLAHGGGVAGAIVRRGGRSIQDESDEWVHRHGAVPTGGAVITSAGTLPARHVIHAVGPVWGSGDEVAKLASAVHSALALAAQHQLRSLSMPAISAGIFGFPRPLCAQTIIARVHDFLVGHPEASVRQVNIVLYDRETADIFVDEARRQLSHTGTNDA